MSYENSAACKLVATDCAICGRPLVDAESVETGIGPICREKYFVADGNIMAENIDAANKLVHFIAVHQTGVPVMAAIRELQVLGFSNLAMKISTRVVGILIKLDKGVFTVTAPYTEAAVNAMRSVPGRRYSDGINTFPESSRMALWAALKKGYPGYSAMGPKGFFTL